MAMPDKVLHAHTDYQQKNAILVIAHTDDEIIWFLPWLHQFSKVIVASIPITSAHSNIVDKYSKLYDANWYFARGMTSYQTYIEYWLNQEARQESITDYSYDVALRDLIADPNVHEIWTHNPWGCYGHYQHRQTSAMVRRLACEYGKDVWCPNIIATLTGSNNPHSLYDCLTLSAYSKKYGQFNADTFHKVRQYFLDEPVNQTFPINYWTWGGPEDYPQGRQEYFLAVAGGVDLTEGDPEIEWMKNSLPVYGI